MALFHTFQDAGGEWRWHLKANNGRIIADSAEGYSSLTAVREAAERVKEQAPGADVD